MEIWHNLEVTHERTSHVKESILIYQWTKYVLFKMNNSQPLSEMYTPFTNIVTAPKVLGRNISNVQLVNEISFKELGTKGYCHYGSQGFHLARIRPTYWLSHNSQDDTMMIRSRRRVQLLKLLTSMMKSLYFSLESSASLLVIGEKVA